MRMPSKAINHAINHDWRSSITPLRTGYTQFHKPKLGMVTMAQGLNLKIIHSAIDFMVGFFLTVHSQERTRNLQKKNTWFTMVYPHSPRKKTSCVPSRWWFHGYSSFVDKPTSWIILVDECHDPTLTQSNIPLWNTIGVSPFGPVRDEKKKKHSHPNRLHLWMPKSAAASRDLPIISPLHPNLWMVEPR